MELQEKLLHHIWDQRHLIPELLTISGKSVKIIYQGQYNTGNGPDFKNVMLILDGDTIRGDVEIHIKTYDWTAHQHQEDPAYNNTILHVVLDHKSNLDFTIKEDAGKVEILELKNQIDTDIAKLFEKYGTAPPIRNSGLCDFFCLTDKDQWIPLLKAYAWERFVRKCNRFNAELHFEGFDQLLYSGFMEAMGYSKNRFNMLSIANNYKWNTLCEYLKDNLNETALAAIWLHHTGLLEKVEVLLKPEISAAFRKAFEEQKFSGEKGQFDWNLFRVRPANHPVRRIIQASSVVVSMLDLGFLKTLLDIIENAEETTTSKEIINKITDLLKPTRTNVILTEPIGKVLLLTIIGNIFLPVIYLFAEKTHNKNLTNRIKTIYFDFPSKEKNHIINFMHGYLSAEQKKLVDKNYFSQQGLMNLYYKFCNYRLCEMCLNEKQRLTQNQ